MTEPHRVSTSFRLKGSIVEGLRELALGLETSQADVLERLVRNACAARGIHLADDLTTASLAPTPPPVDVNPPPAASGTPHVPGQLPLIDPAALEAVTPGPRPPLAATHADLAALDELTDDDQGDGWTAGACWSCLAPSVHVRLNASGRLLCRACAGTDDPAGSPRRS